MHTTTIDPKRRACLSHYVKAGQKWEVEEAEEGVLRLRLLVPKVKNPKTDLELEIDKERTGDGPLSKAERIELNELRIIKGDRGKLGVLNQARLDHLEAREG